MIFMTNHQWVSHKNHPHTVIWGVAIQSQIYIPDNIKNITNILSMDFHTGYCHPKEVGIFQKKLQILAEE